MHENYEWLLMALAWGDNEYSENDLQYMAKMLGMESLMNGIVCVSVFPKKKQLRDNDFLERLNNISICRDRIRAMKACRYLLLDSHMKLLAFFDSEQSHFVAQLDSIIKSYSCWAGIGQKCYCLKDIAKSAAQAQEALGWCNENMPLVEFDDVQENINNRLFLNESETILEQFRKGWDERSILKLEELAENIRDRTLIRKDAPYPTTIRRSMQVLLSNMMQISAEAGIVPENILKDASPHETLWNQTTTEELISCLNHYAKILSDAMNNRHISNCERQVQTIHTLMRDHLSDPELGLEYLGHSLGLSAKYLSFLFASQTGEGFVSCLRRMRLEKAKTELVTSKKTIRDISEICGFRTPRYFNDVFKSSEGMTPLQYRKNNLHMDISD